MNPSQSLQRRPGDLLSPEGLRYAADVVEAWWARRKTRVVSDVNGQVSAGSLRDAADKLEAESAAAPAVDAEVEELARWLYERGANENDIHHVPWESLPKMGLQWAFHVGEARDLIAAGWKRQAARIPQCHVKHDGFADVFCTEDRHHSGDHRVTHLGHPITWDVAR